MGVIRPGIFPRIFIKKIEIKTVAKEGNRELKENKDTENVFKFSKRIPYRF